MDQPSHDLIAGQRRKSPTPSEQIEEHDFAKDSELHARPSERPASPSLVQPQPQRRLDTVPSSDCNSINRPQTPGGQSWSAASERQAGHGSQADPSDRVFPIRSVVSVEPTTTGRQSTDNEYFPRMSVDANDPTWFKPSQSSRDAEISGRRHHGSVRSDTVLSPPAVASPFVDQTGPRRRNNTTGARSSIQADAERTGSQPLPIFTNDAGSDDEGSEATRRTRSDIFSGRDSAGIPESALDGLTTTRFKHVTTDDGHLVITGRDGTLQRCEDEPIHTPGAVQGFGLLLAIREEPDGRFTVRYASENSKRIIGYTPLQLFRLNNFTDILTEEQADNLLDHIDFIRDEDADPSVNGPEVFSMSTRLLKRK